MVRADGEGAEGQVAVTGQGVGVEQQLLGVLIHAQRAVGRARAAVVARVFVAGGGALVVQPGAPGHRQGQVGLADTALDLLEQRLAQLGLFGQLCLEVGVLGPEMFEHLGAVAQLKPAVGVGAGFTAGNRGVGHRASRLSVAAGATMGGAGRAKAVIISPLSRPSHDTP